LSIKLKHVDAWTEARRRLAGRYLDRLSDSSLKLPFAADDRCHAWHLFVCLHPDRDRIRSVLAERDIQTGLHYPIPVHLQPAFRDHGHVEGDFPVSERIGRECLSLPLFPEMTDEQQSAVIDALGEATD
jgi:dTDP-4-amino-4,6-dideoxygalactose transaminase